MSVRAGTRIDGRYRLSERIAVGGMGEVWRGTDEVLGRAVAVKILRAELAEDDAFRRRFRAEARTAGGLPHNGIAAVFDYGESSVGPDGTSPSSSPVQGDGIAYLVMELVPGEALSTILARDGALGTDRTLALVAQAARALHAAHQRGVVHRDVKPANLLVTPEGRVKVTDFGIARPLDHEPLTMTGQVMGTAHYLAPELARGMDASPLSDVYALGVVTYECLAGHRPFDGDNQVLVATAHLSQEPPPLPGTIPADVIAAVGAAMEKEPGNRVASAEAFAVMLEKLRVHDPTALDGVRRAAASNGGLQAAQAPPFVPDVPPPPDTRANLGPGGYRPGGSGYGAAAAGAGSGGSPVGSGPGGPASTPDGNRWSAPITRPQGTPVGPPSGAAFYTPAGLDSMGGAGGGLVSHREPAPREGWPTPLLVLFGVLALVVIGVLLLRIFGGFDGSPGTSDTPSSVPTSVAPTGPSHTTSPTTAPTGSASVSSTASHKPSRSKTPSPSVTASPSATLSPSVTRTPSVTPDPSPDPSPPSPDPSPSSPTASTSVSTTPVSSGSVPASPSGTAVVLPLSNTVGTARGQSA